MLGQEVLNLIDAEVEYLATKWNPIIEAEWSINQDRPLYLFTWSPDPDELPDSDFQTQHRFNVSTIAGYLNSMELGIACVEASQRGVPHYHGWYQLSDDPIKERVRLAQVKTLERFGNLKITRSKGHMKIASWSSKANCLYYYKKDLLQSMSWIEHNPVLPSTKDKTDWNLHVHLFSRKGRMSLADMEEKINLREFYNQFYDHSL